MPAQKLYKRRLTKDEITLLYEQLRKAWPSPKSELNYVNPYTLLVAVTLSAQATDKGVNRATEALFKVVTTPEQMISLGDEGLKEHIKTIGLYNNKAKNVIAMSKMLVEEYDSQVPEDREALVTLPGVGRKTANVVLNVAFGHETFAVDTHIFRVGNRTGLAPGKTPEKVEAELDRLTPVPYRVHAHHWLILHGRYVCKARKPDCQKCPIYDLCQFRGKEILE